MEQDILGAVGSHTNLSFWNLFWQADWIVKLVMLGLIFASLLSWSIIFEKLLFLRSNGQRMISFEKRFWSGTSLDEIYTSLVNHPGSSMGAVFVAGMREWRRSMGGDQPLVQHLRQRVDRIMEAAITKEQDVLERRLFILATIGSTSPFVGLFGTVWGIMNSFQSIAVSKNTSLAVVAPGIAEALMATAIGLFAAIPAVLAYNKLTREVSKQITRVEIFADDFAVLLSRQMDEQGN